MSGDWSPYSPEPHRVTAEDAEILMRNIRRIAGWSMGSKGDTLLALGNACGDYLHYGPGDPRPVEIKL